MSLKFGDARMPSLRDKIREQALIAEAKELEEKEIVEEVDEVKVVKKGRRLNK